MFNKSSARPRNLLQRMVRHLDEYIWAWETHRDLYQTANDVIRRAVAIDLSEFTSPVDWLAYVSFVVANRPQIPAAPTFPSLLANGSILAIEVELASLQTHELKLRQVWRAAADIADPRKCKRIDVEIMQCKKALAELDVALDRGLVDRVTAATKLEELSIQRDAIMTKVNAYAVERRAELLDLVARCDALGETHNSLYSATLGACYRVRDELVAEMESAAVADDRAGRLRSHRDAIVRQRRG